MLRLEGHEVLAPPEVVRRVERDGARLRDDGVAVPPELREHGLALGPAALQGAEGLGGLVADDRVLAGAPERRLEERERAAVRL